ncbi:MAG TPA: tetratricopeptide repeat protein [Candidatus Cloacimonadota bacterium]|nr:tetratricopeptide repeat protein [Candidatus Cloacimonadota bacterium]HOV16873.1 tetratricopeptide repeat protein [Candidatus Cloacimonadota bacterium]HQL14532.1 tetratricopeptide repeat protein [Candidatus Cloacimonadota bacterium]
MKSRTQTILLLIFTVSVLVISSCSYDNSLYNAKKYFKSARKRPLTQDGRPSPQAVDEYTKAIKKCGYILTEKKNSKQVDDALFILAQSLYYKGNSIYQAKDQFNSLINNFPESPYVPEAIFYIARIDREINQPDEAVSILTKFIHDLSKAKWHPQALLLLADFAIQDKDFPQAQIWLQKVLTDYPKSVAAKEALFLNGKNYFAQNDYQNSLIQFQRVVSYRGIARQIKLDAEYYIALNLFYLQDYQKSLAVAKKLLKNEYRPETVTATNLLIGRINLHLENEEQGVEQLTKIIKNNSRTLYSAEAAYWLGDYYYYKKHDLDKATEYYGKVRTEYTSSPFVSAANDKLEALNLIKQNQNLKLSDGARAFIDKKLELEEKYYLVLNEPDSVNSVYQRILRTPTELSQKIDSLLTQNTLLIQKLDSLVVISDTLKAKAETISAPDTTTLNQQMSFPPDSLSLQTEVSAYDSLQFTQSPNQNTETPKPAPILRNQISVSDSVNQLLAQYRSESKVLNETITKLIAIRDSLETEYIPYAMFADASLRQKIRPDTTLLRQRYNEMNEIYPNSKYTHALKLMLEGKPVRIVDLDFDKAEQELDYALGKIETEPDSALILLQKFANSDYQELRARANFVLGWFYLTQEADTTKAAPYFHEVLQISRDNDFGKMTLRFYDGKKYLFKSVEEDTLLTEHALPDSLKEIFPPDSLSQNLPSDSLNLIPEEEKKDIIPSDLKFEEKPINQETMPDSLKPEIIKPQKPE